MVKREVRNPVQRVGDIHRTPPHSVEAEQGVLGSMLISRDCIGEVVEKIDRNYFYVPAHETIFTVIVDLWQANTAVDLITFTQALRDKNLLETIGGAAFVTSLFTFVPTAANIGYYLEIVWAKYMLRQMIVVGTEGVRRAYEDQDDDVLLTLSDFEAQALAIRRDASREHSAKELVMRSIERIELNYERKSIGGIPTGFAEFDRMTDGMHPTDMIVLAGRPSMGKTSLAMNIAEHVAVVLKKPVGVFSLEMSADQLMDRLLCSRARVNLQKVRDGFLAERDFPSLTAAAGKIAESFLHIDDQVDPVEVIIARMRRMVREKGIVLAIVDYLQLLRAAARTRDRQEEVGLISSRLKGAAKNLKIPIIVCAQLNRGPENRGGKPRMSDLRESGSIEQDADLIGLLLRPEIYEEDEDAKAEKAGEAELIIAKQRNGPTGTIALTFLKEFTRFEDRARNVPESMF